MTCVVPLRSDVLSSYRILPVEVALPYCEIQQFVCVMQQEGIAAKALHFAVLTAPRSEETIAATWGEIDGDMWTRSSEHMKGKDEEHRVPPT